jgi:hypothetical protein
MKEKKEKKRKKINPCPWKGLQKAVKDVHIFFPVSIKWPMKDIAEEITTRNLEFYSRDFQN